MRGSYVMIVPKPAGRWLARRGGMMHSKTIRSSLVCLSLATLAGCGGSISSPPGPGDSVLVDSATAFAVDSSGGGLVFLPPQGAACDAGIWTYTVAIGA